MVTQVGVASASRRQHTEKTPGNQRRGASADWNFDKLLEEEHPDSDPEPSAVTKTHCLTKFKLLIVKLRSRSRSQVRSIRSKD